MRSRPWVERLGACARGDSARPSCSGSASETPRRRVDRACFLRYLSLQARGRSRGLAGTIQCLSIRADESDRLRLQGTGTRVLPAGTGVSAWPAHRHATVDPAMPWLAIHCAHPLVFPPCLSKKGAASRNRAFGADNLIEAQPPALLAERDGAVLRAARADELARNRRADDSRLCRDPTELRRDARARSSTRPCDTTPS